MQFRNAKSGVPYVGSKACAECHADIYQSYRKTDMGRAMSLPGEGKDFAGLAAPVKVDNPKTHRSYEVYRRGTDLYQSEYELDAEGKEVYRGDLLGMTGSVAPALELKKTCGHESSISDANKPSGTVKRYHFLAQIIQQRGGIHTMAHIPRLIHPKWLKA